MKFTNTLTISKSNPFTITPMKKTKTYTMELYAPPQHNGRFVRIIRGNFEQVRDLLTPNMIETREVKVEFRHDAVAHARAWVHRLNKRKPLHHHRYLG